MGNHWNPVILGVMLAITITTVMDASGYSVFSALPLMPLFGLFWWWQKFSKAEIGFNRVLAVGHEIRLGCDHWAKPQTNTVRISLHHGINKP
ncbi:MAG: hypothetical protein IIB78_10155 [Proteobacteria bacterium]|nr:hypothetical protein [Pseudomonadota bacterium]MCH8058218.1 hypothetical protein [Pseudomonadota bacterium]